MFNLAELFFLPYRLSCVSECFRAGRFEPRQNIAGNYTLYTPVRGEGRGRPGSLPCVLQSIAEEEKAKGMGHGESSYFPH